MADATDDLLELSLDIAQRVIQREIEADRSAAANQLRGVLDMLAGGSAITVLVHPDDKAFLEPVVPELIATMDRPLHATLREDESITRGGCIVRTQGGEIDARIETQVERIVDALLPGGRKAKEGDDHASDGEGAEDERGAKAIAGVSDGTAADGGAGEDE